MGNINHAVNNASADVFRRPDANVRACLPDVEAKVIDNIHSMIHWGIHSTGTDRVIAQPYNNLGSFDEVFVDYVPEELIEQPDNSFNHLSSFIAATEASMQFSAGLPMGRSAIASSRQPVPAARATATATTSPTSPLLEIQN